MTEAKPPRHWFKSPRILIADAAVVALLFASAWLVAQPWTSQDHNAGSFVVLLRHGDAPGRGEPAGFNLGDCSTQRNLSDKGRQEARELGAKFHARGINVTRVLVSEWCRTRETAALMDIGAPQPSPAFDDLAFNKPRATELLDDEYRLIASWHGPGVLLIVSHSSNIKALTGINVEHGTLLVVSAKQGRIAARPFEAAIPSNVARCAGCL
jgi:phosphohistidine phosphatase SixA